MNRIPSIGSSLLFEHIGNPDPHLSEDPVDNLWEMAG
jgi:hypothetical protein